jgi:hypothetical protein
MPHLLEHRESLAIVQLQKRVVKSNQGGEQPRALYLLEKGQELQDRLKGMNNAVASGTVAILKPLVCFEQLGKENIEGATDQRFR